MGRSTWLRLDRDIQNHWLWTDKPFAYGQAWIDLLVQAQYFDKDAIYNGSVQNRKKGEVWTSLPFLANRWGWSIKGTRHFLSLLEKDGMIAKKGHSKGTIITIENWTKYQSEGQAEDTPEGTQRADRGQTEDTRQYKDKYKEYKVYKEYNISPPYSPPTEMEPEEARTNLDKIVEAYRANCPSLVKLDKVTPQRQRRMVDRLQTYTVEEITEAFRAAERSKFLKGDGRSWRAGFDWIMESDERISQLIGGAYEEREKELSEIQKLMRGY